MSYTLMMLFSLLMVAAPNKSVLASGPGTLPQVPSSEISQTESLNTHLAALEDYEKLQTELNKRIHLHENRLAQWNNKPHMDPKGFNRSTAKRMSDHYKSELGKIEQQIVWHRQQIRHIQA